MSRAFVKEAEDDEPVKLPDRPISPHPNLVTPESLGSIERTIDRFTAAYKAALGKHDKAAIAAAQRELRYWSTRLATAKLVQPSTDRTVVHFGTTVAPWRSSLPSSGYSLSPPCCFVSYSDPRGGNNN